MQRISIVIVGSSHRDPAPVNLLRQHVAALTTKNVMLVSCVELPCDQTLALKQQLDQANLAFAQRVLQAESIKFMLEQDAMHAWPYFKLEKLQRIREALPGVLSPLVSPKQLQQLLPNTNQIATYILNYLALEESVKLNKALGASPYQGIERPMLVHDKLDRAMTSSPAFFRAIESNRMSYSADKILQDAINKADGNDVVIICQSGALHAQRLAATIKHKLVGCTDNREIAIFPMICFSNYSEDVAEGMVHEILMSHDQDHEALIEQYRQCATPVVTITENQQSKTFSSVEFDQVMSLAVAHIDTSKVYLDAELHGAAKEMMAKNDIGTAPGVCSKLFSNCQIL
jgi:hypothetical protein